MYTSQSYGLLISEAQYNEIEGHIDTTTSLCLHFSEFDI